MVERRFANEATIMAVTAERRVKARWEIFVAVYILPPEAPERETIAGAGILS